MLALTEEYRAREFVRENEVLGGVIYRQPKLPYPSTMSVSNLSTMLEKIQKSEPQPQQKDASSMPLFRMKFRR